MRQFLALLAILAVGGCAGAQHSSEGYMRKAIQTDNAPKPIGPYSQAIVEGDFIFLAGQGPTNPATGKVELDNVTTETKRTFENMKAVLEAAGSSLDKVVKVNVLLHSMLEAPNMNDVYARFFPDPPPARTVCGARLPDGVKVMIECTALA